jgi:hypothetical protein
MRDRRIPSGGLFFADAPAKGRRNIRIPFTERENAIVLTAK